MSGSGIATELPRTDGGWIRKSGVGIILAFLVGVAIRYGMRDFTTPDTYTFLLPWYRFAVEHGLGSLKTAFTNYTPFYSYLLILATLFDSLAQPWHLIKGISFVFELASAALAGRLVKKLGGSELWAATAFAAVWLGSTFLYNGAKWGQADSIWTFFVLLSIYLFCIGRSGMIPFAIAFAIKAPGAFLGPLVLGMALRGRVRWLEFGAVPLVYLVLATPVLVAGRPLWDVLTVYLQQAYTFHNLTLNAANVWVFVSNDYYQIGVLAGLVMAAAGGLALALAVLRSRRTDAEYIVLAACASLLLMPLLLPKMHERYFYAFEVASIVLACLNPRYAAVAVIAQVDGVLSYLVYDRSLELGLPVAAACNTVQFGFLMREVWRNQRETLSAARMNWLWYFVLITVFAVLLVKVGTMEPGPVAAVIYAGLLALIPIQTILLLRHSLRTAPTSADPSRQAQVQPG